MKYCASANAPKMTQHIIGVPLSTQMPPRAVSSSCDCVTDEPYTSYDPRLTTSPSRPFRPRMLTPLHGRTIPKISSTFSTFTLPHGAGRAHVCEMCAHAFRGPMYIYWTSSVRARFTFQCGKCGMESARRDLNDSCNICEPKRGNDGYALPFHFFLCVCVIDTP